MACYIHELCDYYWQQCSWRNKSPFYLPFVCLTYIHVCLMMHKEVGHKRRPMGGVPYIGPRLGGGWADI